MKDNLKFMLLTIGIILVFFIMGREIIETKTKLRRTQDQIVLEKKEKVWLQDELKTTKGELIKADRDLRTANSKLGFVNKKMLGLKGANNRLIMEKHELEYRITLLQEEKRVTEAKLHSLGELKKAIHYVKLEMRDDRVRRHKEWIRQQEEIDEWKTALGNRGFLTKDGVDNYKPKVNIEVRPANISFNKNK